MTVEENNSQDDENAEISDKSKLWPQYLAVLTACLATWACGINFAWPSPSIPIILNTTDISEDDTSYIAIMQPLGDMIGAPLAAVLADTIGRKMGILLINVPLIASWTIIAFSNSTVMFCVGRLISGIGEGFLFNFFPMYVGEVAEPKVRGILGSAFSVVMFIGMLMINCIAPFFSIQTTALICLASPILAFLAFLAMPESPYFFIMKDKQEKAKEALIFLRRCDVTKDLQELNHDVKRQMSERGTFKELFTIKSNRNALLIMIGVRTMQQLSGISAWITFTQKVFLTANPNMSPVLATILYYVTLIIVQIIGSFQVDKYGRKSLLAISCFLSGIDLIGGGIYFYIQEKTDVSVEGYEWIPIAVMLIYVIVYGFGLSIIPTLMLGEMFSASIKGKALCVMCIYYAALVAASVKFFHFLSGYGMFLPFLIFGISCILSTFFAYFCVPETRGKSLEDIQQYLKGNKISDKTINNNNTETKERY